MILFFIHAAAEIANPSIYDQSMDTIATLIARIRDTAKQKTVLMKQPPDKLDALIAKVRERLPDNPAVKERFEQMILEIRPGDEPQPAAAAHEHAEQLEALRADFVEHERATREWSQELYMAQEVTENDLKSTAQRDANSAEALMRALKPLITKNEPHKTLLKKAQTTLRSLKIVHEHYKLLRKNPAYQNTTVYVVQGVDPYYLCGTKNEQFFHHAVCQIESNFNFVTNRQSLQRSLHIAQSNPIALIVRNAHLNSMQGLDLQPIFRPVFDQHVGFLADGVLSIQPRNLNSLEQVVFNDEAIQDLNICTQESLSIYDTLVTLVFNAAPSFANQITPRLDSREGRVSQKLITLQYKALGQIAATKSVLKNDHVTLHVTLLGQGPYNNPPTALREGFAALLDTVKGFNVSVFIHGANDKETDLIRESLGGYQEPQLLTAEEFM